MKKHQKPEKFSGSSPGKKDIFMEITKLSGYQRGAGRALPE